MKIYTTSSEPPAPPGIIFIINAKTRSETLVAFSPTGLCVGTGGTGRGTIGMNSLQLMWKECLATCRVVTVGVRL